jgi:PAS domain S-box-containing protein
MFRNKFNKSLQFRFLTIIFCILVVATMVTSIAIAINEGITNINSLKSEGTRLASYVAQVSQEALITKDTILLDAAVNEADDSEDIAYCYISDAQGKPLTSLYASINYRLPAINAILLKSAGKLQFPDIISRIKRREPTVEVSVPVKMGPSMIDSRTVGKVIMGLTENKMRRDIARTILFIVIFNIGGAIFLGFFFYIASTKIIFNPISELARASTRLATGDLSTRVHIDTMGEVATLVKSFNEMVDNLQKVTVSKEYMDNILKSMINTLLVVSADNTIMSCNAAASRLLGYMEGELIGQPLGMIITSETPIKESWMSELLAHGSIDNVEELYRTKDGRDLTVLLSASVMRDENHLLRGIIYVAQDISTRKQAENDLKESEERLRYLASQLMDAQERERKRVAHELHDNLGQSLLTLKLQFDRITRILPADLANLKEDCQYSLDYLQEIIEDVRRLSYNLTPAVLDIGLKAAITDLIDEFNDQQSINCSLKIDDIESLLSFDYKINLYRIVQEALTNISKYSKATQVLVSLQRLNRQVVLAVEDDGESFDVPQVLARRGKEKGLGLSSMEERARIMGGTFAIASQPDSGTKITITVPLRDG